LKKLVRVGSRPETSLRSVNTIPYRLLTHIH
jgi:hypothetical protein